MFQSRVLLNSFHATGLFRYPLKTSENLWSRPKVFCKTGVLRNFAKFTRKHLYQSLFFNKVAALRPATLLKKRLWHRCFLWILWDFKEHLFYRTYLDDCFWMISVRAVDLNEKKSWELKKLKLSYRLKSLHVYIP